MELHRRKAQQTKKWRQRREELGSRETVAGESASAAGRGKLKLGCGGGGGDTHTHVCTHSSSSSHPDMSCQDGG